MYYITYNRQLLDYAEKEEISRIEGMMRKSLYDNTRSSYYDYPENGLER